MYLIKITTTIDVDVANQWELALIRENFWWKRREGACDPHAESAPLALSALETKRRALRGRTIQECESIIEWKAQPRAGGTDFPVTTARRGQRTTNILDSRREWNAHATRRVQRDGIMKDSRAAPIESPGTIKCIDAGQPVGCAKSTDVEMSWQLCSRCCCRSLPRIDYCLESSFVHTRPVIVSRGRIV